MVGSGPFGRLVVVHTVTNAADALFTMSLAGSLFFNVSADAARPRILLYLLLTLAPFAVLGPFVAPVVDRVRGGYRLVILVTAVGRSAACVVIAGTLHSLVFFPAAFAVLVLGRTYSVAKSSLVGRLVDDDRHLVASNARLARLGTLGGVAGGLIGVSLLQLASPVAAAGSAAAAHAGAVALGWRLPRQSIARGEDPDLERAEIHQTRLTFAATAMGVLRSSVGFATFLVALVLKTNAEPAWIYGLALLAGAIGGLFGTVVAGPLRRRMEEQTMLVSCLVGAGLVCFVAIATPLRLGAAVLAAAVALAATAGRQAFDSLTQKLAPDAEKGRAFAGFEMRFELAWVIGAIIPVTFEPSLPVGLTAVGAVVLTSGVVYGFALRDLHGQQLVVPLPGEGDRLASSLLALAESAASQGAERLAVTLAHEAALVAIAAVANHDPPTPANDLAELTHLWHEAAAGRSLELGAARRAADLAAAILAWSSRTPPSR